MAETKRARAPTSETKLVDRPSEVPADRPSQRVLIRPTVMEPALENTTRTANKIRDDLGLATHRYALVCLDGRRPDEIVENVRVALLRAVARTHDTDLRMEVLETSSRRRLCYATDGGLFAPDDATRELTADAIVQAERRLLTPM